jgi:ABC-type sugar transport system permease subunit
MSRLRRASLLLVALPAIALSAGGILVAHRSRAALEPEIQRDAAARAAEHFRQYRARLRDELAVPAERLGASAARLAIERFTTYDAGSAREIARFPGDLPPLALDPGGEQAAAMLAAARRGTPAVELARIGGRAVWLAYVPGERTIAVALLGIDSGFVERFRSATGYDVALYLGRAHAVAAGGDWPPEIPAALLDSLASRDAPTSSRLDGASVAAAPLKDFDDWEMTGAVLVRPTAAAPFAPGLPAAPLVALVLGAALSLIAAWLHTRPAARARRGVQRAGFAFALVPPALAAAWLVAADVRNSARATDALLELSAGMTTLAPDPAALSIPELAALAGADAAIVRGDSLGASSLELRAGSLAALQGETGRATLGRARLAYRAVDGTGGTRLILFRAPLEDSRQSVLFSLAALYALLAVGMLIYASLVAGSGSAMELRETITAWRFIAPALILLLVFSAAPLLFAFYLSFHEWNLLEPAKPFVGLRHYVELAGDGLFWNAVKNTAIYSLYVPATMACALAVALLLNRSIKGVALFRAIFFLPYVTSFVAISLVWQWMYDPDFGLLNWLFGLVGLGPFTWLNSPATALPALIIMAVWIHIGFQMVIFLAGLQAIPNEFYEAAMIDGAGPWRRFRHITLPLLRPTTFFVLVTSIIGSFQVFTFVYVMTEGGPLHATDVIVYHIYQNAWQFLRMGYASAMSWMLFAVIFAITLLQFRLLGRRMAPA